MHVDIICDGSCRGNPGTGAYAFATVPARIETLDRVTTDIHTRSISDTTTCHLAELLAIKNALEHVLKTSHPRSIRILTDSLSSIKWITNQWKTNNPEIRQLVDEIQSIDTKNGVQMVHLGKDTLALNSLLKDLHRLVDNKAKKASASRVL